MSDIKRAENFQKKIRDYKNEIEFKWIDFYDSRKKLSIEFGVIFIIVMILLYKYQPSFVSKEVSKEQTEEDDTEEIYIEQKFSYYYLFIYSFVISFVIFGALIFMCYKDERIKKLVF